MPWFSSFQELLVAVPVRDALRFKSMAATTLAAGLTTVSALNHDYIDASVDHTLEVRWGEWSTDRGVGLQPSTVRCAVHCGGCKSTFKRNGLRSQVVEWELVKWGPFTVHCTQQMLTASTHCGRNVHLKGLALKGNFLRYGGIQDNSNPSAPYTHVDVHLLCLF
jgi:hypothetical protein